MLYKVYKIAYLYILAITRSTFNESTCVGGLELAHELGSVVLMTMSINDVLE